MTDSYGSSRRRFLLEMAVTAAIPTTARATAAIGSTTEPAAGPFQTLSASEQAFFSAAVDTLIPADELGPSGTDCGIVIFIDRQLAGSWGAGARLYLSGPFLEGTRQQGYQLPLTPREYFAAGVVATNAWSRSRYARSFDALAAAERAAVLRDLEQGVANSDDFQADPFFEALLTLTMEGLFSDPIYGGNRGKIGWRMLGFPGLPAFYAGTLPAYRNRPYTADPKSIEDFL